MGTTPADDLTLRYAAHRPGDWFLVEGAGAMFLDLRYSPQHFIDVSVLVRLDEETTDRWRADGVAVIDELVERLARRPPAEMLDEDLYRRPGGTQHRDAVVAAIVEHTWAAEQRRRSQT